MAFMTRDGCRLYHEDTGGDGPVVVFLHGAGGWSAVGAAVRAPEREVGALLKAHRP